jgi:predicted MFS family arabinose efflux permease
MAWSIFQTIALVFCPESPRWLIAKNREEEARTTLAKYHANGDASDALVTFEFEEIKSSIEAERHASAYTWLTLFSTAGNIKRSFLIIFLGLSSQWVGNGIVSYYLAPILHNVGITLASQQQGINGGLQIFNWFVAIFGAYLAERVGRKRLLLISAGGMLISMILVTATSAVYHNRGEKSAGRAVIAFLFCFFGSYDIGFTPIPPLYVAEVASTHLRAKYTALYWMCTSVALCFNQYVNSIAFDAISWKYYLVYVGVLCVVIFVLAMYAPETKGRTLEEVGAIFDGGVADNLSRAEGLRIKAAEEEKADVAVQQTEYAGL